MKKKQFIASIVILGLLAVVFTIYRFNLLAHPAARDENAQDEKEPFTAAEKILLQDSQEINFILPESSQIISKPGERNPNQWSLKLQGSPCTVMVVPYDIVYAKSVYPEVKFEETIHQDKKAWYGQTEQQIMYLIEKDKESTIWITTDIGKNNRTETAQTFRSFISSVTI